MSNTYSKDLIAKRKDRAIAIILSVKEDQCDQYLTDEASHALRKVVLDQINSLYDLVLDIVNSLDSGAVEINTHYLDMISELHEHLIEDRD